MVETVGGRFKREETYVYLWLIHVEVWQKPIQYCKAIIFQFKINNFFLKIQAFRKRIKHLCFECTLVDHALLNIERDVK